jgi:hypothetical protein
MVAGMSVRDYLVWLTLTVIALIVLSLVFDALFDVLGG